MTTEEAITQWQRIWAVKQAQDSQHDTLFWKQLATRLIDDRLKLGNNPLVPIGQYAIDWPGAMELLTNRNNRGIDFEKNKNIDAAIEIYELGVADAFFGTHPYDRLRIIYSRQKWYSDAVRVCRAYLSLPDREFGQDKAHFENHLSKLLEK